MSSYLHALADSDFQAVSREIDSARPCCSGPRAVACLHQVEDENGERKLIKKFGRLGRKELAQGLRDSAGTASALRLFFISGADCGHGPRRRVLSPAGVLEVLAAEAAGGLSAEFLLDVCGREEWTVIPTRVSSDHGREPRVAIDYGFFAWAAPSSSFAHVVIRPRSTDYYCVDFPEELKKEIIELATRDPTLAAAPLALDVLIARYVLGQYRRGIAKQREDLRSWEATTAGLTSKRTVEQLHRVSIMWHAMLKDFQDIKEHLDRLNDAKDRIRGVRAFDAAEAAKFQSNRDLDYLQDVRGFWARWVTTYLERTNTRINLMHHLSSQSIAFQTRRESIALLTLAIVTVVFLPGTFVSSVLSTSFFSYDGRVFAVSENAKTILVPSILLATFVVLAAWFSWYRWRLGRIDNAQDKESPRV